MMDTRKTLIIHARKIGKSNTDAFATNARDLSRPRCLQCGEPATLKALYCPGCWASLKVKYPDLHHAD